MQKCWWCGWSCPLDWLVRYQTWLGREPLFTARHINLWTTEEETATIPLRIERVKLSVPGWCSGTHLTTVARMRTKKGCISLANCRWSGCRQPAVLTLNQSDWRRLRPMRLHLVGEPISRAVFSPESLTMSIPDQWISAFYTSDDKDTSFQAVCQGLLWVISSYKYPQLSISFLFQGKSENTSF